MQKNKSCAGLHRRCITIKTAERAKRFVCPIELHAKKLGIKFYDIDTYLKDLERMVRQLNYAATHNRETGTLSRNAFIEEIENRLTRRRIGDRSSVLVILDIDGLKAVNDTYGHHAGDLVIARLVLCLKKRIRVHDLVGRLGGDEFGVYFDGAKPRTVTQIMKGIRAEYERAHYAFQRGIPAPEKLHPSFSFGLVSLNEGGHKKFVAYAIKADKLMYEEKLRRKKMNDK